MAPRSRSSSRIGVIKLVKSIVLQCVVLCCLTSVWHRPTLLTLFSGKYHRQGAGVSAAVEANNVERKNSSASAWTSGSRSNKKQVQLQPVVEGKDKEKTGLHVRSGSGFLLEFVRKLQQLWASLGRRIIDFILLPHRSAQREEERLLLQHGSNGGDNHPSKSGLVVVNNADAKGTKNLLNDIPVTWNGVTVTDKEKQMLYALHAKRVALMSKNCKTSKACKRTQAGHNTAPWLETASSTEFLRFLRHKHGNTPDGTT